MKAKRAYRITTNGKITRLSELEGKEITLKSMYSLIDCHTIEHIGLKKGVDMWIDENGKLEGLEINPIATRYFHSCPQFAPALYAQAGIPVDFVVGTVIVTDNTKEGGFIKEKSV